MPDRARRRHPIVPLPRPLASRYGTPVLTAVDATIFTRRYFTHCLRCGFCHDWCCASGVDMDLVHHAQVLEHAAELETFIGIPRQRWFQRRTQADEEFPGGGAVRTRTRRGACVFLNRGGRGCQLHAYADSRGIDYHDLKSIVDCLFPLTFSAGLLCAADEVEDGSLVCLDQGPTLYRGVRGEVAYYFGDGCVAALDDIEREMLAGMPPAQAPDRRPRRRAG